MKPLKLKMTAFGPYKDTESIDFTELKTNRLFVISGNTGAGKTTIFDGICFALYGSASGRDRENITMLRSDFAEDDTHTAVELVFTIHGRKYRILRQLGHVKTGNKSKTGDRYEFFEIRGDKEVPCVDRQIVSEIDKKVESIIGLTQDQFKQIVMLPQGEFRKLLTSQTENKEAILRRLFKTESYKIIGERLKEKRSLIEERFKQEQQTLDTYVQNIHAALPRREESALFHLLDEAHFNMNQLMDAIAEEITFLKNKITVDEKKYDEAYEEHEKKAQAYYKQKAINERFTELAAKENRQKELGEQAPLYKEKEVQLKNAEKANELRPYEKQLQELRKDEKIKQSDFELAQKEQKEAESKQFQAKKHFEEEEKKQQDREAVNQKLNRLHEFLPAVKAIDEEKNRLQIIEKNLQSSFTQLDKLSNQLIQMEQVMEKEERQIKALDKRVDRLPDKKESLSAMREKATVLKGYLDGKKKQDALVKEMNEKQRAYEKIKSEYIPMEKRWLHNQAAVLASHLHEGEACPVCGSETHPNKTGTEEELVTKEQLESVKKMLDEADALYRELTAAYKVNKSQLKEKQESLLEYHITINEADQEMKRLVEDGKRLNAEVIHLEKDRKKLTELKETHEKTINEHKKLDHQKKELDEAYQKQKSEFDRSVAVHEERIRVIPEEARSLNALEKKIKELDELRNRLNQAWEQAQKDYQQARETETKAVSNCTHAVNQLDDVQSKRKALEKHFAELLKQANFTSEEAYQLAKLTVEQRQTLKDDIDHYNKNNSTIKQQIKELQIELKDKQKTDLTVLHDQLKALKGMYEHALKTVNQSKEYEKEALNLKMNIKNASETLQKYEEKLMLITDLYDAIRGQNSQKISFERYLQIEYLEQIIDAANHRLKRLSNGQFLLMRSDRQEAHGRQSGLALDVYDAYTGLTRDVKTLSGGEKFNASLCLALGMSDVIQSFQGNIAIDTMFIDEGFGSLDEESLNKSIDTLIDLQHSGRMIGVISHVKELKAIFPAVLEVTKTKEGNSRAAFVMQ
ncbi:AAA family ATPase [Virgibacillus sp. W0181]|uniref:AAA family ATPase n=1 Tax=Virgibacillus sp. W0181 TaxID=3391581 RepID=UPI003F47A1CB